MRIKNIEISRIAENVFRCDVEYDNKKDHLDIIIFKNCDGWLREVPWASIEFKFLEYGDLTNYPIKEIYRLRFYTKHEDELDIYLMRGCAIKTKTLRERLDAIHKHKEKIKPEDWENEINGCLLVEGYKNRYKIPFDPSIGEYNFPFNQIRVGSEELAVSFAKEVLKDCSNWRDFPLLHDLDIPKIPKYSVIYVSPYFEQLIYSKEV